MQDLSFIPKLQEILREFQKIDHEFPLRYALCLAEISKNEGLSITELSKNTRLSLSTVSRIVGALSCSRQKGDPYNVVVVRKSEIEGRRKELFLTDKGRAVMSNVTDILKAA